MKQKVIVILGPTATGKSALAVELARAVDGEVVSADSRQIYRGLDLGTGKVTRREMRGVPHHMLDILPAKRQFSASEYAQGAHKIIASIAARGKVPIVCGGTGFYIDALLGLALPEVPPDPTLRARLEKKTAEAVFAILEKIDPARARAIDPRNKARAIRSIEIAKTLGAMPPLTKASAYETLKIGLDMQDAKLKERIAARLKSRLKSGMLAEASRLHAAGLSWKRMRELGLEYRNMADHLAGSAAKRTDRAEFERRVISESFDYAKRQRRWFRRDKDIVWLDPAGTAAQKKAVRLAKIFLRGT